MMCGSLRVILNVINIFTGDEIDSQYQEELDEIVQLTGSPEKAFSMFYDIVKNLFEWDENGGGKYIVHVSTVTSLVPRPIRKIREEGLVSTVCVCT